MGSYMMSSAEENAYHEQMIRRKRFAKDGTYNKIARPILSQVSDRIDAFVTSRSIDGKIFLDKDLSWYADFIDHMEPITSDQAILSETVAKTALLMTIGDYKEIVSESEPEFRYARTLQFRDHARILMRLIVVQAFQI